MHFSGGSLFSMISILRKNLTCLLSSDAYHPSISCTLYRCLSSTSKEEELVTPPAILHSFLRKHELSSQLDSKLSPVFNRVTDLRELDSSLSFLKENGFSNAQLEKILKYRPTYLLPGTRKDSIKLKIRALQSLELARDETAKIISKSPYILSLDLNTRVLPSIFILKELVGTNQAVAQLWKRLPWLLNADLEETMVPNIEFLKSFGLPMERILKILCSWPRCLLLKPDVIRESAEKVEKMGVSRTSRMFIHALFVVSGSSSTTLALKLKALRDFGFTESSDIVRILTLAPHLLTRSANQLERARDVILATGKYDLLCIIKYPASLCCSVDKKYKPRFRILKILESKDLIKKWPALSTICTMSQKAFFDRFVDRYLSEVGEVYLAKNYVMRAD